MTSWDESIREKPSITALKSPQVWGLLFGALFLLIGVPLEYLGADEGKQELSQLVIGLCVAILGVAWAAYNFGFIRKMVSHGVFVVADVAPTTFSIGKLSRLVLRYTVRDSEVERTVNCIHPSVLRALKDHGSCEILVDPEKPKRILLVAKL